MLHKETVAAGTLDLIRRLMSDEKLQDFNLAGGTALALQLGHRVSVDIDLFSQKGFDVTAMQKHLEQRYRADIRRTINNSMAGKIDGIAIDLMAHQYPSVRPPIITEGIRMASFEDIAAMKLNVITRDPDRLKDFIDIHYMLEHKSLKELTDAYEAKYPNVTPVMAHLSLLYHKEIDFTVPINLISQDSFDFKKVAERLQEAVKYPDRTFGVAPPRPELDKEQELRLAAKPPHQDIAEESPKKAQRVRNRDGGLGR